MDSNVCIMVRMLSSVGSVFSCIRQQVIEVNGVNVSVITDISSNGASSAVISSAVLAIVFMFVVLCR